MASYDTLTEALDDLDKRGFVHNFNLKGDCIECSPIGVSLQPDEFEIVEFYRFEGMTDPADSAVVYAIQSKHGLKGVLVNAYGVYADEMTAGLVAKLRISRQQ